MENYANIWLSILSLVGVINLALALIWVGEMKQTIKSHTISLEKSEVDRKDLREKVANISVQLANMTAIHDSLHANSESIKALATILTHHQENPPQCPSHTSIVEAIATLKAQGGR